MSGAIASRGRGRFAHARQGSPAGGEAPCTPIILCMAHNDVHQTTWNVDDVAYGGITDEGGDPLVVQRQLADLGFADISRNIDTLTHLAIDLDDQCEGFIVRQGLVIAWPISLVDATIVTRQLPQLFCNVWGHRSQQLYHRLQRLVEGGTTCYRLVLLLDQGVVAFHQGSQGCIEAEVAQVLGDT